MNYTLDAYGTKQSKIKKCIITGKCPESWWSSFKRLNTTQSDINVTCIKNGGVKEEDYPLNGLHMALKQNWK